MYVLDLFSGIGGFSLGFERAGARAIAFCEADAKCRRVLGWHWPNVPIWRDVRDLCGLSVPRLVRNRQTGRADGDQEQPCLRPDWIVVENVAQTWRKWVPELRRALWERGYASLPLRVRASNVGAYHERARIFLVANANGELLRELSWWWDGPGREVATQLAQSQDFAPARLGADDGLSNWVDRRRQCGNAVVPQIAECIARGIAAVEAGYVRGVEA